MNRSNLRTLEVLVMDDDRLVLSSMAMLLESIGHKATQTAEGSEAVQKAGSQSFDLAILDLSVPGGLGGRDIADQLRALQPTIKLVVSSGFGLDDMAPEEIDLFDAILEKPFRLVDLIAVLEMLDLAAPEAEQGG